MFPWDTAAEKRPLPVRENGVRRNNAAFPQTKHCKTLRDPCARKTRAGAEPDRGPLTRQRTHRSVKKAAHAEIAVADGEQRIPPLPALRIEAAHGQRVRRVAHRERILCVLHSHPSFRFAFLLIIT